MVPTSGLAGTPRAVPWAVHLRLRFGGPGGLLGWAFLAMGSLGSWVVVPESELMAVGHFRGRLESVPGVVIAVGPTRASEDDRTIHEVEARYQGWKGEGRARGYSVTPPPLGAAVVVELDGPAGLRARIRGLRTHPLGLSAAVVLIFPVIGLMVAGGQLRAGGHALRLLRDGRCTTGRLLEKHPTRARIDRRRVYRLVFEFQDALGCPHRAEARTHEPELLEDETREQVLYDPARPSRATLVDHLPGAPRVDAEGRLASPGPVALLAAALPLATALINAYFLLA